MPIYSRLKGFLPATSFAMAVRKKFTISTPEPATTLKGQGNRNPELLFVGESLNEAAKALLNKMIEAMGVKVSDVFVAEVHAQSVLTHEQVRLLNPKLMVSLGSTVTHLLLGQELSAAEKKRGILQNWNGIPLIASFSPEDLIKNPASKKEAWEDLKFAMKTLQWKN